MLGRALAMEWMSSGHLLGGSDLRWRQPFGVCGGGAIPASAYKQGIGVAFKQR